MLTKKTPEEQVLETLERIESLGSPFYAVYVAMSKLSPENRGYRQLEIVSKLFEPLLAHTQGRLFLLSNHDFLLLTATPSLEAIDDVLYQIRSLFTDDVFISLQKPTDFQQIFFLDKEMDILKAMLSKNKPAEEKNTTSAPVSQKDEALTPEILEKVLGTLEHMETLDFIRRQPVVKLSAKNSRVLFHEYYTSILNLQKALSPSTNFLTDTALFHQLTETLDRRMLGALTHLKLYDYPPAISLNLNISSISLPIFDKLMQAFPTPLIIEFEISDILNNTHAYFAASDLLRKHGHRVAIDGISAYDFEYLDILAFKADFIKLFWSPKWTEEPYAKSLYAMIKSNPNIGFILSRCGSEEALNFGKKAGITLFQGRFIDAILAAIAKNTCTFGQECTLSHCMLSRSVLSGQIREQCVHQRHLDAPLAIKAV